MPLPNVHPLGTTTGSLIASTPPRPKGSHTRPLTLPPSQWRNEKQSQIAAGGESATSTSLDTLHMLDSMTAQIEKLQSAYHIDAKPMASDDEYDALVADLRRMVADAREAGIPVSAAEALLSKVGAPVKPTPQSSADHDGAAAVKPAPRRSADRNGAAPFEIRPVEHTAARGGRLLSLAATHSEEELRSWWARSVTNKLSGAAGPIAVEPKVDGLTLRLSYEGGQLIEVLRCALFLGRVPTCCRATIASLVRYDATSNNALSVAPAELWSCVHNQLTRPGHGHSRER